MAIKKVGYEMQELFIKHLKNVVPAHVSLVDELADLLKISNDSAYRRLRNETVLSLDETQKICSHYHFSIDSVLSNQGNSVNCNYIKLTDSNENFNKYLSDILEQLQILTKSNESKITYAAQEIPIFHSFFSKELAAFKLFYWQRSVLNVPDYQNKKFDFGVIGEEQLQLAATIYNTYRQVASAEIWTDGTVLTTIRQIEYYFDSGAFKLKTDAVVVLQHLKKMLEAIENAAEHQTKLSENNVAFNLYNSDSIIGTNCIHINVGEIVFSYISFNTVNSLTSSNKQFCEEIEH